MQLSTLRSDTDDTTFESWRSRFWDAVVDHDLETLEQGLSVDYILVLLTLDRALRTAMNLKRWDDLAWAKDADVKLRRHAGPAQKRADAVRTQLGFMLEEICLVAGAGVSQAAGLPGWKGLVVDCLRYAEAHATTDHHEELRDTRAALESAEDYTAEQLRRATEVLPMRPKDE